MDFTWLNAANDLVQGVIAAIGATGGIALLHKLGVIEFAIKLVKGVVDEAPRFLHDAEQVADGVGQLIPAVGDAEAKLRKEVEDLKAKARQTELYRVAAVGLHAFGVALDALSDDQRKALEFDIASKVPGVTPQEVADALALVQRQADETAASPLITAANALTQAKQAQAQPAQQATA